MFRRALFFLSFVIPVLLFLNQAPLLWAETSSQTGEYRIGIGDVLEIHVLQPDQISIDAVVSPDGQISFPYLGSIPVKNKTLEDIQQNIQKGLSDGFMRFPVVSVLLKEAKSQRFFVYGEVEAPGAYPLEENMTVFKAISIAGGFTKFGSSSHVRILRPKTQGPGYETMKVDIEAIMKGKSREDVVLKSEDVVVVSEGML